MVARKEFVGLGGVIRGHDGVVWMEWAFSVHVVKLLALTTGLLFAHRFEFTLASNNFNSIVVVGWVVVDSRRSGQIWTGTSRIWAEFPYPSSRLQWQTNPQNRDLSHSP
uniref:Uncharacterized protein n=1 Tax=Cannabis sativa TaxID=3483 RepID=A0A803QKR9_CANSA